MATTTQAREPEMGLTFEKVWAMFQESDRRMQKLSDETDRKMQETDRKMQETAQQMRETDRIVQETAQQMRETDQQIRKTNEETAKYIKDTDRQIKETNEQIGKLGNRFGELAEHLVVPNIEAKFNALGFHFNYVSPEPRVTLEGKDKQILAEFDILLENGESSVVVEVKVKPTEKDVKDHIRRLRVFRRYKDTISDKRKIYGALAGAIMLPNVKAFAIERGFYAIIQTGDTVKIDIPEGFTPKAW
jgi:exonuclease VII large subunit